MAKMNDQVSSMETHLQQPSGFVPSLPTCDDEISLLALSDNELEDGLSLATEPQQQAVKAKHKANKPSHEAIRPPPYETNVYHTVEKTQPKETAADNSSQSLCDPDSALSSWAPQKDFSSS